ncbi:hypothetical protein E4U41_007513 [Claviceps citrina]|nr:hypothetical protein E4U41_007513 [Claviceps citrina]
MPSLLAVVALLRLAELASGQPTISFPFNAQLPPVARIDEFFSYSFSPYTFQSDSKISYSLGDHPSWLSIESEGRRLFGTPRDGSVSAGEVVGQTVDLVATDGKGSTSMNATIVVSRAPAPQVQIPLEKQIPNFGHFSAPSSILSYPSTSFGFSFDQGTFGRSGLNYYAVSGDSSPLPAWVEFEASSLTFSGKTPPLESLIQPPHTFDFNLVASDIVGFSASSLQFSIVVGSHKLTTDGPIVMLNASRGSEVNYNGLENGIKLDGKQVAAGDLTVAVKDMPSWLSFDQESWKLHGTPKDGDRAANFTITFKDGFSDELDVLMVVKVATGLFASTVEDIQLRPGSELDLDLTRYFRTPSDVIVTVSTSPSEEWLMVDGLKLSGQVPMTSKGGFKLFIQASSKSSDSVENETVNVSFLAADGATITETPAFSTTTTTATAAATESENTAAADAANTQSGHLSTGEILLATIIPLAFLAILLMILVCCIRRRRNKSNFYLGSSSYCCKISGPVPGSLGVRGSGPSRREAAGGAFRHTETMVSKPAKAPLADDDDDGDSPMSSRQTSSESSDGLSTSGMPRSMIVDVARTTTIRSISNVNSEDGRQSWVTVDEGNDGGLISSDRWSKSQQSDVTHRHSTCQVLPGSDYASHKRCPGLEITLPTLEELPSLQPTPLFSCKHDRSTLPYHGVDSDSGVTSSSAALPHMKDDSKCYNTAPLTRWNMASTVREPSDPNWITLAESEASTSVLELKAPVAAALAGSGNVGSWSGKSVATDVSFGSSENWRVIGRRSPIKTERSYKELVDESPFHPSQPSTADGHDDRAAASPGLASPGSHWRGPSESMESKMSGVSDQHVHMSGGRGDDDEDDHHHHPHGDDNWIREHSTNMSDGSYKVFL